MEGEEKGGREGGGLVCMLNPQRRLAGWLAGWLGGGTQQSVVGAPQDERAQNLQLRTDDVMQH